MAGSDFERSISEQRLRSIELPQ